MNCMYCHKPADGKIWAYYFCESCFKLYDMGKLARNVKVEWFKKSPIVNADHEPKYRQGRPKKKGHCQPILTQVFTKEIDKYQSQKRKKKKERKDKKKRYTRYEIVIHEIACDDLDLIH